MEHHSIARLESSNPVYERVHGLARRLIAHTLDILIFKSTWSTVDKQEDSGVQARLVV